MSELTISTALGRITRIDGDFIALDGGLAFWLDARIRGEGIMLGDEVHLQYDIHTMQVLSIRKADKAGGVR